MPMEQGVWQALAGFFTKKVVIATTIIAGTVGTGTVIAINAASEREQNKSVSSREAERRKRFEDMGLVDPETIDKTFRVVFPYKAPSSDDERRVKENSEIVPYMNYIRGKHDLRLVRALADTIADPTNRSKLDTLMQNTSWQMGLAPSIPEGTDMRRYQQSRLHYQGTHVPATPTYWQATETGRLVPLTTATAKTDEKRAGGPERSFTPGRRSNAIILIRQDNEYLPWMNELREFYQKKGSPVGYWTYSSQERNPTASLDKFMAEHTSEPGGGRRDFYLLFLSRTSGSHFDMDYLVSRKRRVRKLFIVHDSARTAYPGRARSTRDYNGRRIYTETYRVSDMDKSLETHSGMWIKQMTRD